MLGRVAIYNLKFILGTSVVAILPVDLPNITALEFFEVETDITFRTVGVTSSNAFSMQLTFLDAGSYLGSAASQAGVAVDTTVNNDWRVTVQWDTEAVNNQVFCETTLYFKNFIKIYKING